MSKPIVNVNDQRKATLCEKVYANNLEACNAAILELMDSDQAPNEASAVNKLIRAKGTVTEPEMKSVVGRFSVLYKKKPGRDDSDRGFSAFLVGRSGGKQVVTTVHINDGVKVPAPDPKKVTNKFGEIQSWNNLQLKRNLFTGNAFYTATPTTKIEAVTSDIPELWDLASPVTKITDTLGLYGGYISGIFQKNVFTAEGEKTDELYPIVQLDGTANLSIGITSGINEKTQRPENSVASVSISSEKQLKEAFGATFSDEDYLADGAIREIGDAFRGAPIIVFGRGATPGGANGSPNQKRPSISIGGGLGRITILTSA